jgi:hypothetical protein
MSGPVYGGGALQPRAGLLLVHRRQQWRQQVSAAPCTHSYVWPCADEVNAVVLDVGTYHTKAGYAGEDTPKFVFPSVSRHVSLVVPPRISHSRLQ